ncbi:MAG: DUF1553 domain-containing protein [Verrucomicrobiota bacterium]|jgi:hypothetical protein|nr:DUF1553 domain-containing protein [Verrucomicrobiota bacterium]
MKLFWAILPYLWAVPVFAQDFTKQERAWWAFQPVRQPAVPKEGATWARNQIDHFVAQKHVTDKIAPAKEASRRTLIRRVTFDLTGLPPTPGELDLFLQDSSPDAYGKMVDRLLASPRYGEHQAQAWLDLVRYADSDGYNADHTRPEAWRYRDYVIKAFNTDKPYDRFVAEQIAGDEIDPGNRDALTATMYLRHWIYEFNQRDVETQWSDILNDITDVTGDVFLAMGMQCARCHEHKFDPILQRDYFRLRAFFEPLQPREAMPVGSTTQRAQFLAQQHKWEEATRSIRQRLHEIEQPVLLANTTKEGFDKFNDDIKAMIRKRSKDRKEYEHQIAKMALRQIGLHPEKLPELLKGEVKTEWEKLRAQLAKHDALKPKPLPTLTFVASDVGPVAPPTYIPKKEKEGAIEPGFLSIIDPSKASISPPPAALQSTGRRTALAKWLTRADNPLTTRVIVNRLWKQHFGHGLAANPSDFGSLGNKPTHPELLDWLARRFVEDGWSLKKLHRLMVTSATYRMGHEKTVPNPTFRDPSSVDPENKLLWHYPIRRLDAGAIRDAALAISGELAKKIGGPGVDLAKTPRRSVYGQVLRNKPTEMLQAFDSPDAISHASMRNVTTTATQSLLLLNGQWLMARAEVFAQRLEGEDSSNAARVKSAYRLTFGREPTVDQLKSALEFLELNEAELAKSPPLLPKPQPVSGMLGKRTPSPAALLKADSSQANLHAAKPGPMPKYDFTVEALIELHSLYPDASVRTIVSQWDSKKESAGWSFGVTSTKSSFKPRNLILQLIGDGNKKDHGYEVIASDLRPELKKPYYAAVSVKFDETGAGMATFYLRDLSSTTGKLQVAQKQFHQNKHYASKLAVVIGGRANIKGHVWDGLIDDVRLSNTALGEKDLVLSTNKARPDTLALWRFAKGAFYRDESVHGNHLLEPHVDPPNPRRAALADFCHALLNANESVYVD